MTSTTMVKNNPLKIVELHPTWWFLFLFLPKPNKQLTENMTFTWWKLLLYILKACTVHIFFGCLGYAEQMCRKMSMDLYMCIAVETSTNINMRTCVAKMCLVASAVLSNCPGPLKISSTPTLRGENDDQSLDLCGLRCVTWKLLELANFDNIYIYIYNLLKLWGQILKCEVISSMFYVQPLTYCINL